MGLFDIFDDSKKALDELRRDKNFRSQNKEREDEKKLQMALGACRGKLEISRTEFERSIRNHSKSIKKGLKEGRDILLLEQTLWDAAIGYMLVSDAIFALESINSYDSVERAYELLDEAVKIMTGKAKPKESLNLGKQRGRGVYGHVTSKTAIKRKEDMLESFFSELKESGDIEACLDAYRNEQTRDSILSETDSVDDLPNRLSSSPPDEDPLEDDDSFYSMDAPRK